MKNTRRVLIGAAAFVLSCGLANAAFLTESFTTIPQTATDFDLAITAAKLNCVGCTITSIDFTVSSSLTTSLTVTAGLSSSASGTTRTELMIGLDDNDSFTTINGGTQLQSNGNFGANGAIDSSGINGGAAHFPILDYQTAAYTYNLAAGASTNSGSLTKNSNNSWTFDNTSVNWTLIQNEFTGTGNASLFGKSLTQTVTSQVSGNAGVSQTTTGSMSGTITFNYTQSSVPEPTTMFLMGSALVGVGLLRKRIKS